MNFGIDYRKIEYLTFFDVMTFQGSKLCAKFSLGEVALFYLFGFSCLLPYNFFIGAVPDTPARSFGSYLDNSTTASRTLSPLLELVSRKIALWSLAIRAPSSNETHALRLIHELSLKASRRSVLLPHNMIGIRFSATSCQFQING